MQTISRMYDDYGAATAAVTDLEAEDIPDREISMVANADAHGRAVAERTQTTETHASTGAATGAGVGAVAGGAVGLLVGIGTIAIPGLGPLVAAGWLAATLAGAGAGAASGGLVGALTGSGVSRDEAEVYEEGVRRGATLVSVRVPEAEAARVEAILDRQSAVDWRTRRTEYAQGGWAPPHGASSV